MLYALHYEKYASNDINGLLNLLKNRGVSEKFLKVYENEEIFIREFGISFEFIITSK